MKARAPVEREDLDSHSHCTEGVASRGPRRLGGGENTFVLTVAVASGDICLPTLSTLIAQDHVPNNRNNDIKNNSSISYKIRFSHIY